MSVLSVRPFNLNDSEKWDNFVENCVQSTFLHTRLFLSYHKDRFVDQSLIIENEGNWVGLFPAAEDVRDSLCICSHPGITYGGILHQGDLKGAGIKEALEKVLSYFSLAGYKKLTYKVIPDIYHLAPAQDDIYAIFLLNGKRYRCDLSCAIDLRLPLAFSGRRKRGIKKASKMGVEISHDSQFLAEYWQILSHNLGQKFGVKPAHRLDELLTLIERFPTEIKYIFALLNGKVIAGTILFNTKAVLHAQYIGSSEVGKQACALDLIFDKCIQMAISQNKNWFDFGISTEDGGRILNQNLFSFKSEFGGGGVVHEFYEWNLGA